MSRSLFRASCHTFVVSAAKTKNAESSTSDSALQSRPSLAFIINAASPRSAAKMGMSGWVGAGKAEASSESANAPQVGEFREEDQNLLRFPSRVKLAALRSAVSDSVSRGCVKGEPSNVKKTAASHCVCVFIFTLKYISGYIHI